MKSRGRHGVLALALLVLAVPGSGGVRGAQLPLQVPALHLGQRPPSGTISRPRTFAPPGRRNVQVFGARGDGVADDAPAIQRALDSLPPTGGIVYIPAGTYLLGTGAGGVGRYPNNGKPIESALIIRRNNTVITGDGPSTILTLMDHKKMRVLSFDNKANITLEKVAIDGNKENRDGSVGWPGGDVVDGLFHSRYSRNITVRGCEVRNTIEGGFGFWHNTNALVENCYCHDNGTPKAGGAGIGFSGGQKLRAIDNHVAKIDGAGIWVSWEATDVVLKGNTFTGNTKGGIVLGGFVREHGVGANYGYTITNNTLDGNKIAGLVIASASRGVVSGNRFTGNQVGIKINDNEKIPSADWKIQGNVCAKNEQAGIDVVGKTSRRIALRGNTVENNGRTINDQIVVHEATAVNSDWQSGNTIRCEP